MDRERIRENPVSKTKEYPVESELKARLERLQRELSAQQIDFLLVKRDFEYTERWLCNAYGCVGPSNGFAVVFQTGRVLCTERTEVEEEIFYSEDRSGCIVCTPDGSFVDWASEVDIIDYLECKTKDALADTEDWHHPTCDLYKKLAWGDISSRVSDVSKIGVVDPGGMPVRIAEYLAENFPNAEILDATELFCRVKAVKSGLDLELMDDIAKQHDTICGAVTASLQQGAYESEICNRAKFAAYRLGAGGFNWMKGTPVQMISFPMGERWSYAPISYPGRAVNYGDCVLLRLQSSGINGLYGAIGRCWTMGKPSEDVLCRWQSAVEVENYCASQMKPGVTLAQVRETVERYMRERGLEIPHGNYIHGLGFSLGEAPQLRGSDSLPLRENMVVSIGIPVSRYGEGPSPFICEDMYVITLEGGRRLTSFPQEIVQV